MKHTLKRTILPLVVILCALVVSSGCTLAGAEAPPPVTIAASNPGAQQPTRTPVAPIVTPTIAATIDVFGTQTAIARTSTPGIGGTPVAIGGTPTPGIGISTLVPGGRFQ